MNNHDPLPAFIPTAPPHPSSGGGSERSETSSVLETYPPPITPHGTMFSPPPMHHFLPPPHLAHHPQTMHCPPPPFVPMGPIPPVEGLPPHLAMSPPMLGMAPLPPWNGPMFPPGLHGSPFKLYSPTDGPAGPPPSALGFEPIGSPPMPTVILGVGSPPMPTNNMAMHSSPFSHPMALPPPPHMNVGPPVFGASARPQPYLPHTTLFISSIAHDSHEGTEEEIYEILKRQGVEPTSLSLMPAVHPVHRIYPDDYYSWMPKHGQVTFRGRLQAEKALAILETHPYLLGQLRMVISPWPGQRAGMPLTNVAPRIVRPANEEAAINRPLEGDIWDCARSWGSIKTVSVSFEMDGPAKSTIPWKAIIDFWHEDEAAKFESDTNATGFLRELKVSVVKDLTFIPKGTPWPPRPWDLPPASWQQPFEPNGSPWQPPMGMMGGPWQPPTFSPDCPPPPNLMPTPMPDNITMQMQAQPPLMAPPVVPEQNLAVAGQTQHAVAPPMFSMPPPPPTLLMDGPPMLSHPAMKIRPNQQSVEQLSATQQPAVVSLPPTPPSPATHPLPPRPDPRPTDTDSQADGLASGKASSHRNGSWRRGNTGRPPPSMFGGRQFEDQSVSPGFAPVPWANHHKFSGGVPLPSPPWETVPLRRNSGGFKNHKGPGPKSQWYKVDGGLVASDGQVLQHVGPNQRHFKSMPEAGPIPFGSIDPCNLIIRELEPDISATFLHDVFARFGPIKSTRIMRDPLGRSRGFGFVKFAFAEDANVAITNMDNTKLGSKWIKVTHHRPNFRGPHFRRENWNFPSPAQDSMSIPKDDVAVCGVIGATTTHKQELPGTNEASESGSVSSENMAESSNGHNKTASALSSEVEEVTELLTNINLEELTLEALSAMPPTRVLKVLTSGGDQLLRRLNVTKCPRQYLPIFWGLEHPQRLEVIRYVNKVSPPKYRGKKRSDITMSIRGYVNSLSEKEEWALVNLLPYHKLIIAMALKDTH
ncbi:uncharacterized protein CcaverHIS019_0408230 [Cutaneotrichosporon cavernicola]|uniref:RRM domain-containing protein n=1 Tax=Cutaneotrichosporon cavernicola TaxID=279322 RepID=A0AA48L4X6_9TREE|nr:uncharacterized protein CcaverHIS019_0408230 [Cutaneotrichosporon cavernicola]BEI92003.1 hypothetical protein CcaverHIS019_0408230 [Cutaneotrichosporon cavernicola]